MTKLLVLSEARVANKNGSLMEFEQHMPEKVYARSNHRCMYVHACMYVCMYWRRCTNLPKAKSWSSVAASDISVSPMDAPPD